MDFPEITEGLTRPEQDQLVALLRKMGPRWSQELAEAIGQHVPLTGLVAVIINDKGEVLLRRRNHGDMLPSVILMPQDLLHADTPAVENDYHIALDRLLEQEVGSRALTAKFAGLMPTPYVTHAGTQLNLKVAVFACTIPGTKTRIVWTPPKRLPDDCPVHIVKRALAVHTAASV